MGTVSKTLKSSQFCLTNFHLKPKPKTEPPYRGQAAHPRHKHYEENQLPSLKHSCKLYLGEYGLYIHCYVDCHSHPPLALPSRKFRISSPTTKMILLHFKTFFHSKVAFDQMRAFSVERFSQWRLMLSPRDIITLCFVRSYTAPDAGAWQKGRLSIVHDYLLVTKFAFCTSKRRMKMESMHIKRHDGTILSV